MNYFLRLPNNLRAATPRKYKGRTDQLVLFEHANLHAVRGMSLTLLHGLLQMAMKTTHFTNEL